MKIISGSLKGRIIKGYDIEGTRPTMDRVKESVFGIIQNYVKDSTVLDLFAGTGNYGIEAISNGSKIVYFNDYNRKCIDVIKTNLNNFNVFDKGILLNMDYKKALLYLKEKNIKFDLIFLDPPYKNKIIEDILDFINDNNLLNNKGLIICELTNMITYDNKSLILIKERKYGDKSVLIYQNKGDKNE